MSRLPSNFWDATLLPVSPFLAELRAFVLDRSHARLPKWKFRLADDLVVQIQPKPGERRDEFHLFECRALQGVSITAAAFQSAKGLGLYRLDFGILADALAWSSKSRRFRAPRETSPQSLAAFRDRVIHEMRSGRFDGLSTGMMFAPACLVCGKGLTDPASIARWIGPECYGSGSLSVPGTLALPGAEPLEAAA